MGRVRLVIADYIALASPQTRLMILSSLVQTEAQKLEFAKRALISKED